MACASLLAPALPVVLAERWPAHHNLGMRRRLELYRFCYFDGLRQRWLQARYVLEAPAIRCRYPEYDLIGPPEIRHVDDRVTEQFSPFRSSTPP